MWALLLPKLRDLAKAHWKAVVFAACIALAFTAGRFLAPTKVQTRTVERAVTVDRVVEKRVEVKAEDHVRYKVVYRDRTVTTKPDGTVERRDVTRVDNGQADSTKAVAVTEKVSERVSDKTKISERTVERILPQWRVSALVGADVSHLASGPVYGAHAERRLVGPLWVGAWGLSNLTFGASLGVEF